MDLNNEFTGAVAFVTGAGSGIGRETALLFAKRGAIVACVDLDADRCMDTVAAIREAGGEAAGIVADLSRPEDCERAVDDCLNQFGRIDHAFNNAGITGSHEEPFDLIRVEQTIAVDLLGVIYCMKHQVAVMEKQGGGTIINTASIAGLSGNVGALDYTAAKHGVVGLTGSAARKYGPSGIRINAVCPGIIRTAMTRALDRDADELRAIFNRLSPITGKPGEPADIAEAVLFLSSSRAKFIHGVALPIDGGFTI
ncbi:SDR family oxidoreductase [Erythrobacter litoralis]|uniref:SDR family NAD(P)-dependent oxidoreductase n=1 Tax=Erythrobacter litoralis TaxID=39960 RepID=UPI00243556F7|nr:SDR family oxidoreductase [Erythrobacter litoralis]MDG6079856.1 SDR family oxidoreductase [Erythrobacter litoralis]